MDKKKIKREYIMCGEGKKRTERRRTETIGEKGRKEEWRRGSEGGGVEEENIGKEKRQINLVAHVRSLVLD